MHRVVVLVRVGVDRRRRLLAEEDSMVFD